MKSLLWNTFGLTTPIVLGLIGFSSPSEGLIFGGRVAASLCGDVVELTCASDSPNQTCLPMSKWGDENVDSTDDDHFIVDGRNDCERKNPGTECNGTGNRPKFDAACVKVVVW